jgi:hypothetical protein
MRLSKQLPEPLACTRRRVDMKLTIHLTSRIMKNDVLLIKRNSSQIFLSSAFVAKILCHLERDPLQEDGRKSSSKSRPVRLVQRNVRDAEPSSVMKEKVLWREQCCNVLGNPMLSTFVRNCNFCNSSSSPCVTIRGGILIPSHAPWWRLCL